MLSAVAQHMVISLDYVLLSLNPLTGKSDQHQISLHNINTNPKEQVMRMNKMITKGKLV